MAITLIRLVDGQEIGVQEEIAGVIEALTRARDADSLAVFTSKSLYSDAGTNDGDALYINPAAVATVRSK